MKYLRQLRGRLYLYSLYHVSKSPYCSFCHHITELYEEYKSSCLILAHFSTLPCTSWIQIRSDFFIN
jgi:hypothetical protein